MSELQRPYKQPSAFLTWGADGTSTPNPDRMYMKKGGKVKKAKKAKAPAMSQNVKVNVKVGDTVMLRKGNAPRRSNPGVAKRFLSQGSAFGGGLPGPLSSGSYASVPQVAMPLGRMDFIGSGGDGYHNRGRDSRNDIQVPSNPAGIRADITPSIRAVQNTNAVATPDTGLATARALQKSYDALDSGSRRIYDMMQFEGEVPRIGGANLQPSSRASASKPSSGYANMNASSFGSLSEMSKAQAEIMSGNAPGSEQEFARKESDYMLRMGINPETGSPLPSPRSGKSAEASSSMRRGGSVF